MIFGLKNTHYHLFEGEPEAAGGGGDPAPVEPTTAITQPPAGAPTDQTLSDTPPSIYGDLNVEFPEGIEDELKNESLLKPFVDKEGKFNYANVLKSYAHTKKMVGRDNVKIPGEDATDSEKNDFFQKLGFEPVLDNYKIERAEDSIVKKEFADSLKQFAYENKMPVATANSLLKFIEKQTTDGLAAHKSSEDTRIAEELATYQKEMGQGYDKKIHFASEIINNFDSEEGSFRNYLNESRLGDNPKVIEFFSKIGEKLYKEDSFQGQNRATFGITPNEAKEKYNEILADQKHPYFNENDARHEDALKEVKKLFEAMYPSS